MSISIQTVWLWFTFSFCFVFHEWYFFLVINPLILQHVEGKTIVGFLLLWLYGKKLTNNVSIIITIAFIHLFFTDTEITKIYDVFSIQLKKMNKDKLAQLRASGLPLTVLTFANFKTHFVSSFDHLCLWPLPTLRLSCNAKFILQFPALLLLCITSTPLVEAIFFKGGGQERPRCHHIYETVYSTQCSTTYTQQCSTVYETKYETEYENACTTSYEQQCKQIYREVPDKQCSTVYEQECVNEEQTTYETAYRDDCQSVPSQVTRPLSVIIVVTVKAVT